MPLVLLWSGHCFEAAERGRSALHSLSDANGATAASASGSPVDFVQYRLRFGAFFNSSIVHTCTASDSESISRQACLELSFILALRKGLTLKLIALHENKLLILSCLLRLSLFGHFFCVLASKAGLILDRIEKCT